MDSDQGKLFIGGISWETDEERLREYFSQYGDVLQAVVMKDKITGRPRGFGFVVFSDPSVLDTVLQDSHSIDGRTVEAKRALSREEQHTSMRSGNSTTTNRSSIQGGNIRTKKIFVGGLPPTLTEELFRQYFEAYGHVTDVVIMYDQTTQRPRGFGFISFDNEDAVDQVLHKTFHDLNGKQVEVKRALPKDANPSGGPRLIGTGSSGMGGYPGFGSTGGVSASHDRMDSNRYMQTQTASGFPPYGSSGYSTPVYGYGSSSNGVSYGFNYGSAGGYGGGFNMPPRNGQGPSYGSMGYGNATSWGGQGAGTGGNRYGNQGYAYSYGQNEAYGNPGGYGGASGTSNSGGEMGGGYGSGGYGDSMGSGGYGNAHWRTEPPSGNYGNAPLVNYGVYGGPQQRQSQQQ